MTIRWKNDTSWPDSIGQSSRPRAWKLALIHEMNPDWEDLYQRLNW